jgi:hypothetical protein
LAQESLKPLGNINFAARQVREFGVVKGKSSKGIKGASLYSPYFQKFNTAADDSN